MPRIVNQYYEQALFVGRPLSTGFGFMDNSGIFSPLPLIIWSDENRCGMAGATYQGTFESGLFNVNGNNNVTKLTVGTTSAYHGLFKSPGALPSGTVFTGLVEGQIYVPSSNVDLGPVSFQQNGNVALPGFTITTTGRDIWYRHTKILPTHCGTNGATDNFGILLTNALGVTPFTGNGSDYIFYKNMFVILLNGPSGNNYFNTTQQLQRIQSIDYSVNVLRRDILTQGMNSRIAEPIINYPTINLEFTTLQYSLENEHKVGLTCNFPAFFSGYNGGSFYRTNPSILSGFYTNSLSGVNESIGLKYPFHYSDKRNFYISKTPNQKSFSELSETEQLTGNSSVAFGNCYLVGYSAEASVGQLPLARFSYLAENISVNDRNYGINPGLTAKEGKPYTGSYYILPTYSGRNDRPTTILPGDIILNISGINSYNGLYNAGITTTGIKIQRYNVELNLDRDPVESLGYMLPINRVINYPVFANIDIDLIANDDEVYSLADILKYDLDYNIDISLNAKCLSSDTYRNNAIKYLFNGAKLVKVDKAISVDNKEIVSLSFSQEIDPLRSDIGMSLSGVVYPKNMSPIGPTALNRNVPLMNNDFFYLSGDRIFLNSNY